MQMYLVWNLLNTSSSVNSASVCVLEKRSRESSSTIGDWVGLQRIPTRYTPRNLASYIQQTLHFRTKHNRQDGFRIQTSSSVEGSRGQPYQQKSKISTSTQPDRQIWTNILLLMARFPCRVLVMGMFLLQLLLKSKSR